MPNRSQPKPNRLSHAPQCPECAWEANDPRIKRVKRFSVNGLWHVAPDIMVRDEASARRLAEQCDLAAQYRDERKAAKS